jgi:NADH-quinone oxidoreductase subunit L
VLDAAWLIPLIPALSFVLILLFGKKMPRQGSEIGIVAIATTFVLSCVAGVQWIQRVNKFEGSDVGLGAFGKSFMLSTGEHDAVVKPVVHSVTWWQNGAIKFGVGIQIDGLAVMMLFVVTLISLLVHIYSTAYMKGDIRFTYFYAALSLFTASMLILVVAPNTLQLLVGWELVGLCSFMLIGHWWEEGANSNAALKAFLTTRTGDIGLMIGIIVTFFAAGTFNIVGINQYALSPGADHTLMIVGASCLLIGIIGKSGQFPLHTWLPDAMAGPTPVSALIHAATMVVAGVYLGARVYGVFWSGFNIGDGGANPMAIIGAITILIGAALAFVQDDIKKVLAYSTISQLGYMVMGLGVGSWVGAVFHLFTHAFFKALLFLGAGSVSHSGSHHSFDMKKDMGGLRKYMPITFWTFLIGSAALAGIAPLAGFWSKDEILATAGQGGYEMFAIVGLIGAFLTAAYMTRCVYLTFFGEYRGHGEPHESPKAITVPLIVLAVFSVFAGLAAASTFIVLLAIGVGVFLWFREEEMHALKDLTKRNVFARRGYAFLVNKYYLDDLYEGVIVAGIKGPIARVSYWINQNVIDAVVKGAGLAARAIAGGTYTLDHEVLDAGYDTLARETGASGGLLRRVQTGRLQWYALVMFAAIGVFALALVIFS